MVIETEKLTKYYGKKLGCRDVDIYVQEGEIFGLLGPNGAGKSTFIKMMTGLIFPTSGSARLLGKPVGDVDTRRRVGYLPENFKYQEWMTGEDLLSFHASLYKLDKNTAASRINEVLELVKLKGHEKYKVGIYSKGMQQRIGIACALLPSPLLLFLDEPTSALDPIGRKEVRDIMLELKSRGTSILLNSHLLSEVEMVCDSAAIINKGTIIKQGKMEEMLESQMSLEAQVENINDEILKILSKIDPGIEYRNNRIVMKITNRDDISNVAAVIIQKGGRLYELAHKRESLENLFISLVEGGEEQ